MRSLLLAAALIGLAAPALAASFHEGAYNVEGTNLDGSAYKGTAEVKLLSDTTCQITWTTGSTSSVGLAYRQGDNVGVTMYHLNDDGSLDGTWTVAGQNGNGTEKLTPQ